MIGWAISGFGHTKRTETKRQLDDKLGPDDSAIAILVKDADRQAVQDATAAYCGKELAVELADQAAMQISALATNEEIAEAVGEKVEVGEEVEA